MVGSVRGPLNGEGLVMLIWCAFSQECTLSASSKKYALLVNYRGRISDSSRSSAITLAIDARKLSPPSQNNELRLVARSKTHCVDLPVRSDAQFLRYTFFARVVNVVPVSSEARPRPIPRTRCREIFHSHLS